MDKQSTWKWIDENREEFIKVSDKIWEYAELGLVETKSSKIIAETLERHDFKVQLGVAGMPTGILAEYGEGKPIIGLMGEYDALPGISNVAEPRKEAIIEGAPGHGCGHNIHGTTALAAAIAIRYTMENEGLKGTIRFYGTPAEENYGGKVYMVTAGLFDDVDACLSHHPSELNVAGMSSSTATNDYKFEFFGKTAHAAGSPEQGRSALDAVELMNIGVNYLREHVIQEARIHYVIEEGGGQPNVVPDYARSWYYIRAPERSQLAPITKRILKIAEGAAMMTETRLNAIHMGGLYNLIPNKVLADAITANMREIGAPTYTEEELEFAKAIDSTVSRDEKIGMLRASKHPEWERFVDVLIDTEVHEPWDDGITSPGSTDVADVSWKTPTLEFQTATNVLGTPGHDWRWVACGGMSIGHKSLIFAAKTMAGTTLDLLTSPEMIKEAKAELKKRLGDQKYVPVKPDDEPPLEIARAKAEQLKGKQ
ncbi:MAG: amidohydrolase [Candidatus Bathyarchaeota archaeon]|nr:amidohydrolase [Candidatus Bathyarchaeota archaeon]